MSQKQEWYSETLKEYRDWSQVRIYQFSRGNQSTRCKNTVVDPRRGNVNLDQEAA